MLASQSLKSTVSLNLGISQMGDVSSHFSTPGSSSSRGAYTVSVPIAYASRMPRSPDGQDLGLKKF